MNKDYDFLYKIAFVGDYGVGKTNLIYKFVEGTFSETPILRIPNDFPYKKLEFNEKIIKLQFWDMSGAERFRVVTRSFYRGAHGIILLYDVTNQDSFDNLKVWIKEIQQYGFENTNIMLVGTKSDLVSQKVIDTETGEKLAEQLGYSFFETSSKENININEVFQKMIEEIEKRDKQNQNTNTNQNTNQNQNTNTNQEKCF